MKRLVAGLFVLALLCFVLASPPTQAQTSERHAGLLSYDISQEVTLNGTVSSVLPNPARGMMMGSHLLLATSSGPVDASLASFGLQGKGAVSVTPGQQIEVTGVMKTINDKQVFLTRTVKANGQIYTIRNERGIPMSPQARERASRKTSGEGL
jgi:hypothetical protein